MKFNRNVAVGTCFGVVVLVFMVLAAGIVFLPEQIAKAMVFPALLLMLVALKKIADEYSEYRSACMALKWQTNKVKPRDDAMICAILKNGDVVGSGVVVDNGGDTVILLLGHTIRFKEVQYWIYTDALMNGIPMEEEKK